MCPPARRRMNSVAAPVIQQQTQRRLELPDPPSPHVNEVSNNNVVCDHYRSFMDRCFFRRGWCRHDFFPYDSSVWMKEDIEEERESLENYNNYLHQLLEEHQRRIDFFNHVVFKPSNN